jgi:hypothetical protein
MDVRDRIIPNTKISKSHSNILTGLYYATLYEVGSTCDWNISAVVDQSTGRTRLVNPGVRDQEES